MNTFIINTTNVSRGYMRKKDQEIQTALLASARRIACTDGVDAINIRALASEVGVSVGTVYNYYDSKQAVLLALTEEYWQGVLEELQQSVTAARFPDQIAEITAFLRSRMNYCAEILMKSLHEFAEPGKERMAVMQQSLKQALLRRLREDAAVRTDVWDDTLSIEAFAEFVLQNILLLLQQKRSDIAPFIEVIRRILYSPKSD